MLYFFFAQGTPITFVKPSLDAFCMKGMPIIAWQHCYIVVWRIYVKTDGTEQFRVHFIMGGEAIDCLYSLEIAHDVSSRRNPNMITWSSNTPKVQEDG